MTYDRREVSEGQFSSLCRNNGNFLGVYEMSSFTVKVLLLFSVSIEVYQGSFRARAHGFRFDRRALLI